MLSEIESMGYPAELNGGGKIELPNPDGRDNPHDGSRYSDDGVAFDYTHQEWQKSCQGKTEDSRVAYWLGHRIDPAREAVARCRDLIEAKAVLLTCGFKLRTYRGGEALDIMERFGLEVAPKMNPRRNLQFDIGRGDCYHQGRIGYYISLAPLPQEEE